VFENRVLMRIFEPKGDELTVGRRQLHNEELHNLYSSPSRVKDDEMSRAYSTKIDKRNACRLLVVKPERKRQLRRPRRRSLDNNKMDLGDMGCGGMDWIGLAQNRDQWKTFVNTVMILLIP
jgi:hypothetical protein